MRFSSKFSVTALIVGLVVSFAPVVVSAHSGGTDANGCHAGSQPYHCHGSTGSSATTTTTTTIAPTTTTTTIAPTTTTTTIAPTKVDFRWVEGDLKSNSQLKISSLVEVLKKDSDVLNFKATGSCSLNKQLLKIKQSGVCKLLATVKTLAGEQFRSEKLYKIKKP